MTSIFPDQNLSDSSKELEDIFPSSGVEVYSWNWNQFPLLLILVTVTCATILANYLVLLQFYRQLRRRRLDGVSPSHFYIANLAVADFLVGLIVFPFMTIWELREEWSPGWDSCRIWVSFHLLLCAASMFSTCAVSIERYIGVKYPLEHMQIMSLKRISLSIMSLWIFSAVPSILLLVLYSGDENSLGEHCGIKRSLGNGIFETIWIFYIPFFIMVILYYEIYRIAFAHLSERRIRRMDSGNSNSAFLSSSNNSSTLSVLNLDLNLKMKSSGESGRTPADSNMTVERKQIKLARKLLVLVGVVVICYGPFFTLVMLLSIKGFRVRRGIVDFFIWLRYLNSLFNPMIYAYAVPSFRKAFKTTKIGKLLLGCGKGK